MAGAEEEEGLAVRVATVQTLGGKNKLGVVSGISILAATVKQHGYD